MEIAYFLNFQTFLKEFVVSQISDFDRKISELRTFANRIKPRGRFLAYRELSAIHDAQIFPTFIRPNS
jgi:hypothetical protein